LSLLYLSLLCLHYPVHMLLNSPHLSGVHTGDGLVAAEVRLEGSVLDLVPLFFLLHLVYFRVFDGLPVHAPVVQVGVSAG
jgi:hypothetical protein